MIKSKLKEYKLYENINPNSGTKVSFKMDFTTDNKDESSIKNSVISLINDTFIKNIVNKNVAVKLKSRKDSESSLFGASAEQNGRYALNLNCVLDETSIKINKNGVKKVKIEEEEKEQEKEQDSYTVLFTISLTPKARHKLTSDKVLDGLAAAGKVAGTVVGAAANAGASMAPKMTSPYGN